MLPPNIGNMNLLVALDLDGNKLSALPVELTSLYQLIYINLARNNLTHGSFPDELKSAFQFLQVLDLRNNSLSQVPRWVAELNDLQVLTVSGNPVCSNGWLEDKAQCPEKIRDLINVPGQGCTKQCSFFCSKPILRVFNMTIANKRIPLVKN